MPRPYSADLRGRALRACERAEVSRAEIARRFEIAEATLSTAGSSRPARRAGGKPSRMPAARRQRSTPPGWRWSAQPGAVVVMDNLSAHKAAAVGARLERAGLHLLYLPRYSPELSPIEPCWSKVKALLRAKAARTIAALDEALGPVLDAVTATDARGFFRGCGYAVAPN